MSIIACWVVTAFEAASFWLKPTCVSLSSHARRPKWMFYQIWLVHSHVFRQVFMLNIVCIFIVIVVVFDGCCLTYRVAKSW